MPVVAIIDDAGVMTGVGSFLRSLLSSLAEQAPRAGWSLRLVVPELDLAGAPVGWPDRLDPAAVSVIRQPAAPDGAPRKWLEDWLGRGEADIAYLVSPDRLPALETAVPLVATFHDFNFRRFVTLPWSLRAGLERQLPEWVARCAQCVVSSRFIAAELTSYFPQAAGRVRIVRLGVPAAVDPAPVPRALPPRYLLTVGWLAPHKNQAPVFQAVAELRRRGHHLPLVCAGPNSHQLTSREAARDAYVVELLELADHLGLEHRVDYLGLGEVSDAELAALYAGAAALVVPSLYEAGSFPVREAARAGCPVLCADVPPLAEDVALLGGGALMFDPDDPGEIADAVLRTIAESGSTAARVTRSRALVESVFDWRRTAAGYLAAFEAALAA